MKWSDGKPYYSLNQYYKDLFGQKTYKIALDINVTCPNRDGTLDTRGCIFCSESGSGDFASSIKTLEDVTIQIDHAIERLSRKHTGDRYVAYLQSYTNTYGDIHYLKSVYESIIEDNRICGLSIATRPDCIDDEVLDLIASLNTVKPIFVELGLQTIHNESAEYIRRCYPLSTFESTVARLHKQNIPVIVHLIAGLPGESSEDFLESVAYVASQKVSGIKLQLLHILKDSDLGRIFLEEAFDLLTLDEYVQLIIDAISLLPPEIVVHRITGDGNRDTLVGPLWSLNKRKVLNTIHQRFATENKWQGCSIK